MLLEKKYIRQTSKSHRKKYAQFFTPEPIARIMTRWILDKPNVKQVLEPAFGLGIFSKLILEQKKDISITAFDVDPVIFDFARKKFQAFDNIRFHLEDYLFNDWNNKYDAIICNPPYFKFHDFDNKPTLREIEKRLDVKLSGFTNIYTLFLLKSVFQLKKGGRAAYIVPSEFLNADYGKPIKEYLIRTNALKHIVVFDFKEKIFDDALTTSALIFLEKDDDDTETEFSVVKSIDELNKLAELPRRKYKSRNLSPSKKWRIYYTHQNSDNYKNLVTFGNIAKVMRGIATGANDYFVFNRSKAKKYRIPQECLLPCITKSKDVTTAFFTEKHLNKLVENDNPIYLFDAQKNSTNVYVRHYLNLGEQNGVHQKYLTSQRNPWYAVENRPPAPIWVGVFNRTGLKFVRNEANIRNLTAFHGIYPKHSDLFHRINIDLLFAYLLTDVAGELFNDNRREYGDGLKKFEPNDLNNALMPDLSILDEKAISDIMNLYYQYRDSVLNNNPREEFVEEINKIFIEKYRK